MTEMGHIAYHSIRPGQDERTDTNPMSLSLFDQKLLDKWQLVTSGDLKWPLEG